jgi:hypothetical protein
LGEDAGVCPAGVLPQQVRIVPEDFSERVVPSPRKERDLFGIVTTESLCVEIAEDRGTLLLPCFLLNAFRKMIEEMGGSLEEVLIHRSARVDHSPVEIVLRQPLHSPGRRTLNVGQTGIEVKRVFMF